MAPSCWKDFIYVACCCLGDEYLDEIDEYNKQQNKQRKKEKEKERLCPKESTVQNNTSILRKTQSCCFPRPLPKTNTKKKKRKGINWIIGDEYLNHDD